MNLFIALLMFTISTSQADTDFNATLADLHADVIEISAQSKIKVLQGLNKGGYAISNKVWDAFSDLELFSGNVGTIYTGVKLKRQVEDNYDGLTKTVTDQISIPLYVPLFSTALTHLTSANIPVNFSVGASNSFAFVNVRTVGKDDKILFDSSGLSLQQDVQAAFNNNTKEIKEDLVIEEQDSSHLGPIAVDSLRHARYHRVLNRVAFPLRLPLTAERLNALADYEVMKYRATGTFSFGPSVGYNLEAIDLQLSASLRLFLSGTFEVAIMPVRKRGQRFVWVKVTRLAGNGASFSVGGQRQDKIDAFIIPEALGLKREKIEDVKGGDWVLDKLSDLIKVDIIPFSAGLTKEKRDVFDVGYEFDLSSEVARQAYERMVLGMTSSADVLAVQSFSLGEKAPVRKLFGKHAKEQINTRNSRIKLSYLREKSKTCQNQISNASVEFPDGLHSDIRAVSYCSVNTRGLVSGKENYSFRFEGGLMRDRQTGQKKYGLVAIGQIDDSRTSGSELQRYTQMANSLLANNSLPELPIEKEERKHFVMNPRSGEAAYDTQESASSEINYGRVNIKLIISLNEDQIFKFITTPKPDRIAIAEQVFAPYLGPQDHLDLPFWALTAKAWLGSVVSLPGRISPACKSCDVPLAIKNFLLGWDRLNEQADQIDQSDETATQAIDLFRKDVLSNALFAREYMQAILLAIGKNGPLELNYELIANGTAFGQGLHKGSEGPVENYNELVLKFNKEKAFDQPKLYLNIDQRARAAAVKASLVGELVKLNFELSESPKFVRIQLKQDNPWRPNNQVIDFFVLNAQAEGAALFSPGQVTIEKTISELRALTDNKLVSDEFYKIGVSVSNDGKNFGPITYSNLFRVPGLQ